MPTIYSLLPVLEYDSKREGTAFQVGERTKWTLKLYLAKISASGSVEVVLEASPNGEDNDWAEKVSFGSQTAVGTVQKDGASSGGHFAVDLNRDIYFRVKIKAISGQAILQVTSESKFLDTSVTTEKNLLVKELRDWTEMDRIVNEAEDDVIKDLLLDAETGILDIDLTIPGATEAIRREIAVQAAHSRQREILSRSNEPSALVSLRQMPRKAPGVLTRLRKYRPVRSTAWLGR